MYLKIKDRVQICHSHVEIVMVANALIMCKVKPHKLNNWWRVTHKLNEENDSWRVTHKSSASTKRRLQWPALSQ